MAGAVGGADGGRLTASNPRCSPQVSEDAPSSSCFTLGDLWWVEAAWWLCATWLAQASLHAARAASPLTPRRLCSLQVGVRRVECVWRGDPNARQPRRLRAGGAVAAGAPVAAPGRARGRCSAPRRRPCTHLPPTPAERRSRSATCPTSPACSCLRRTTAPGAWGAPPRERLGAGGRRLPCGSSWVCALPGTLAPAHHAAASRFVCFAPVPDLVTDRLLPLSGA